MHYLKGFWREAGLFLLLIITARQLRFFFLLPRHIKTSDHTPLPSVARASAHTPRNCLSKSWAMHGLHGEQLELCSHTRNQLARARCSWGTRPPPRSISFHSRGTSCSFWRRWLRKTSQLDLKAVHEGDTNISPYKREARRSTSQIKAT